MASEDYVSDSPDVSRVLEVYPGGEVVQDSRLDFFSELFDPLLALNTPGVRPPQDGARVYDNIHKYWTMYHRPEPGASTSKKPEPQEKFERKFLPSQMPIERELKVAHLRDIFTRMEEIDKGPLLFLKRCKDERLRVKVVTRHCRGVRGYCEARLLAFDKYWNMVLQDVTEIWTRLRKSKIPPAENLGKPLNVRVSLYFPKIEVLKLEKKTETCRRHVDELMVRGEQVVLVRILQEHS